MTEHRAGPVILPHPSGTGTRKTDRCLDEERADIECLIDWTKHCRHVFSRFDALARRCLAFGHLGAACGLLR